MGEEHGEHYRGKNVGIFHENLDPEKLLVLLLQLTEKEYQKEISALYYILCFVALMDV